MIGFSNSFEIDILTILKMFSKFKIPPLSKDRDENCPLIFAGGPVITANPIPYEDFYDFISIGDAKVTFDKIFQILVEKEMKQKKPNFKLYPRLMEFGYQNTEKINLYKNQRCS